MSRDARQPLSAERAPWLRGTLRVPGDPILTQLTLLIAAVARGETVIAGGLDTPATAATERAIAALGAWCERTGSGACRIHGLGTGGLLEPAQMLNLGTSPIAAAAALGLVGGHEFRARLTADPEVAARSYGVILDGLRALDCRVEASDRGRLPVTLHGPDVVVPLDLALPAHAPEAKAALLLAALNGRGPSVLTEPGPTWNHTERLLRRFGASVEEADLEDGGRRITLGGQPELRAQPVEVPGDPSLAALGVVAATIVPGSEITIGRVLLNPTRTSVLSALMAMGASIEIHNLGREGEEEVGDLVVRTGALRGVAFAAQHVAPLVADLPLLCAAAAYAEGETVFYLPPNLPLLEQARLAALSQALSANGVRNHVSEETVAVAGAAAAHGGARLDIDDPGIALAMLILGMGSRHRVTLSHGSVIEERFPGFVAAFEEIGASFG